MTILQRIEKIIHNNFGLDTGDVREESKFNTDLGLDDLECVEIVMECEREFNVSISDDFLYSMETKTVKELIDYIEDQLKNIA